MPEPQLVFGVSAGRTGSMMLANLLNSEPEMVCAHEGKIRVKTASGQQIMPFLTLQNRRAYERPDLAEQIFRRYRGEMGILAESFSRSFVGDIAYNYAPFLKIIPKVFPNAKVIFVHRNGVEFVRSACEIDGEDLAPLGWAPRAKALTETEKFVALGRLCPTKGDRWHDKFQQEFDHFERNAWLWSETNRLILDSLAEFSQDQILQVGFEGFFSNLPLSYDLVRRFIGLPGDVSAETRILLEAGPINKRMRAAVSASKDWTSNERDLFWRIAGQMMERLGHQL